MHVCYRQPLRAPLINTVPNIRGGDQFLNASCFRDIAYSANHRDNSRLTFSPPPATRPHSHHPLHPRSLFFGIRLSRLIIRPTAAAAADYNEAIYSSAPTDHVSGNLTKKKTQDARRPAGPSFAGLNLTQPRCLSRLPVPVPGVVAVAGPEDEKVRLCVPHNAHTNTHNGNRKKKKQLVLVKDACH